MDPALSVSQVVQALSARKAWIWTACVSSGDASRHEPDLPFARLCLRWTVRYTRARLAFGPHASQVQHVGSLNKLMRWVHLLFVQRCPSSSIGIINVGMTRTEQGETSTTTTRTFGTLARLELCKTQELTATRITMAGWRPNMADGSLARPTVANGCGWLFFWT